MIKVTGKYIFGLISPVIDDKALAGIDCPGIHVVTVGNFSAIVVDSDIVDYKNMYSNFLTARLLKHQQVIESLMSMGCTVIPMKLGTVARNEREVIAILDKSSLLLRDIMKKIDSKIEIDIVAQWSDFAAIIKRVSAEKEIIEFKANLMTCSQITAEDQQKAGLLVMQALNRKKATCSRKILDALIPASYEFKVHDAISEEIVFNAAFLINKSSHELFDAAVEKINTDFNGELNFKYVGPLPCYSFYTLEVDTLSFVALDKARAKLGLNSSATKDEIKSAYKLKAAAVHPDKNPGRVGVEKEFDETNKAYKILLDYCAASDLASQQAQYSFLETDVNNNALLVKLRC